MFRSTLAAKLVMGPSDLLSESLATLGSAAPVDYTYTHLIDVRTPVWC